MALAFSSLGPRARKVLRFLGFAVLGVVAFVFAFQLTFPFDRVKDRAVEMLADKYEVSIGDVERGIMPGRLYAKAVALRTRPTKADEVATTFYIEQLQIDLGLFALLRGTIAVKLDAKIGPGHIKGSLALSSDGTAIAFTGNDLPSASLPMREVVGLPMSGKLQFAFDLDLPNEKTKAGKVAPNWVKAEGGAELICPSGCTVGDGKSKLRPKLTNQRNQAFAEGGIEFGKLNIDTLTAKLEFKTGKMEITKFETKSPDGELHVDFAMALNQDINQSQVTGCLRFRGSDALLKREPKTHAAISTTGAPLGPDNLFHIKLDGPLREVRRLGQVCGAAVNTPMDSARPNLTVPPELPSRPPGTPTIPQTPPMPIPPPPPPPVAAPLDAGVTAPQGEGIPPGVMPPPVPPSQALPPGGSGAIDPGALPAPR